MTTAYIAARWTDFGQVGHHHARLSDAIERPSVGMRHGPAPRISPTRCGVINDLGTVTGIYSDTSNMMHGFIYRNGTYTTVNDPLRLKAQPHWH
jgi:hypothetical protein